jgi:hypothetical protein
MRTSNDQYKLSNDSIISIGQSTQPPKGAVIWNGYDYKNQYWVFEGKKDTRSLEELQEAKGRSKIINN